MSKIYKWVLAASAIFVIITLAIFVRRFFSNQLEKRLIDNAAVPIRVTIKDRDRTEMLTQMVIFPEQKWILFYFVNTDAFQPDASKPIGEQAGLFADNFEKYTGFKSAYSIELTRQSIARLIDLTEGFPVYLEAAQALPGSAFQYPAGRSRFSGEQAVEYALVRRPQPGQEHMNGLERMRRMETILLNVFWNLEKLESKMRAKPLKEFAMKLIESDLTSAELMSLGAFIGNCNVTVLEVPLELGPDRRLVVKEKRARTVYSEFFDNLRSGRLKKDLFSLEVLNGTEVGGLARRVKQFLQDRGVLVLNADNYPIKPVPKSVVLVRSGRTSLGHHMMEMTALPVESVFFDRGIQDVDVTILLGQDFDIKKLQVIE